MEKFLISPEDCLILRALHSADSLREAAGLLQCDPAGLLRKVQRISHETGLLQKVNRSWELTGRAVELVGWTERAILSQKELLGRSSRLRLTATLWMAEQFLIPNLKQLQAGFPSHTGVEISGADQGFERELIEGKADFAIVCHAPNDPAIAHKVIAPEPWALVVPRAWMEKDRPKRMEDLVGRPFVRHRDLNPDLVLSGGLPGDPGLVMDSLIGVRAAVAGGMGWSFVPKFSVHALLKEKAVAEVPHQFSLNRHLSVWWLRHVKAAKGNSGAVCAWARDVAEKLS